VPPPLTPEEIAAIVSEACPDENRQRREEAEQVAEDAVEQMVEDMLAPDEETGLTPRVAQYPRVDEPSPGYGWAQPRPRPTPTRSTAMAENFARIYGAVSSYGEHQFQEVLRRLGTVTVEGNRNYALPGINTVWQHREMPTLQVQVTRVTEGSFTLRPIGVYRPMLPRLVALPRACFYSWFVPLEDIHIEGALIAFGQVGPPVMVEPKARKPAKRKPRVKPEPKQAPTIWERILSDEDDKD
jgi:hypothetical protein